MPLSTGQVSVGTTETTIYAAPANRPGKLKVKVPGGGQSVFVGSTGVLTTTGFEIAAGETFDHDLNAGETLLGIVAATTQTVSYIVDE